MWEVNRNNIQQAASKSKQGQVEHNFLLIICFVRSAEKGTTDLSSQNFRLFFWSAELLQRVACLLACCLLQLVDETTITHTHRAPETLMRVVCCCWQKGPMIYLTLATLSGTNENNYSQSNLKCREA